VGGTKNCLMKSKISKNLRKEFLNAFLIVIAIILASYLFGYDLIISLITTTVVLAVLIHTGIKLSAMCRPWSKIPYKLSKSYKPFVTVQIACKSEPYDIVNGAVEAMTKLDYPNYEVIVINSNNTDTKNWHKIRDYVKSCGDNFHFVHLDKVDGFKAGALNYLNKHHVHQDAEVIAVVDCDYLVTPDFLNKTVGYFADPKVGIVQAPQNYYNVNKYNSGLYYEYRSFFSIVMHQAQRLKLVTFTGTMGMIRTDLVRKGLDWNEWCITEDVEAGVSINSKGLRGVYVDQDLGRGLMPFDYSSLIKQRQRWAYGNMQIILKDLFSVLLNTALTVKQKFAFIAQLATWFHFELLISIVYLALSALQLLGIQSPYISASSHIMIILLALSLISNFVYFIVGLRRDTNLIERIKAFFVHYGLAYVMSTSWATCALGGKLGFKVTSKNKKNVGIPIKQFKKELRIAAFLIIGLVASSIAIGINLLHVITVFAFIIIEVAGVLYLRRAFIESNLMENN
jgi:cellulose synthase/poly-beta-1,6-N-acetylglucosamine synthase-like glycosyltransferase